MTTFRELHVPGEPLLMPNPWDAGSAKLLASLGFRALATTSGGHAGSLGRLDGEVHKSEVLGHAAALVAAVDVPVSADLENGFADDPAGVAETVIDAAAVGLAGRSIEDYAAGPGLYDRGLAADRVRAAVEAAHADRDLVITAVRTVVSSLDRPVNMLVVPGVPRVTDLAAAGVARISVGGAFSLVALAALTEAARELLDSGSYRWLDAAARGRVAAQNAFSRP